MRPMKLPIRRRILAARAGTTIVEVVISLTLLAVVLVSLAGLTADAARGSVKVAGGGYREGIMTQEVNRLTTLPFASLAGQAGCTTVSTGVFPHTRCVTVTTINARLTQVRVVVTPAQPGVPADSVTFERSNPPTYNPLSI